MPTVHTIRLRGPWDYRPTVPADRPYERVTWPLRSNQRLPLAEAAITASSAIELRRFFNQPTGLNEETEVLLTLASLPGARVSLNGTFLGELPDEPPEVRFVVTSQLAARNELQIELPTSQLTLPPEGAGQVSLEIKQP